jgi:hypothetical protein
VYGKSSLQMNLLNSEYRFGKSGEFCKKHRTAQCFSAELSRYTVANAPVIALGSPRTVASGMHCFNRGSMKHDAGF